MAKDDKHEEAEKLYALQLMTCPQIAAELGVSDGTVYRWKAEAAAQGETTDWDAQRRLFNMSPRELVAIYSESLRGLFVNLRKNPEMMSDSKVIDTLAKHVSILRKLDDRTPYMGIALDVIKIANEWLAENRPEMKTKMEPCWEGIIQEVAKYSTDKGLFG